MSTAPSSTTWIPLAHLLRPQGRKGELLAEPLSDLPDIFAPGLTFVLAAEGTTSPSLNTESRMLEDAWFPTGKNAGRIVLKLSGCDSISQAETLAGQQLLIPTSNLPALDPDTFFVGDLVGCALFDGESLAGTITDIEFATGPDGRTRLEEAAPLFAVQLAAHPEAEPILVPFVRAWLNSVDIPNRRILMHLPPGLLDVEADE